MDAEIFDLLRPDRAAPIDGGAGAMDEDEAARFYRDVRPLRLYEGSSQIQRLVITRGMIPRAQGR